MDNSIAVAAFSTLLLDRRRSSVERLYIRSIRVILILPVAEIRYYHRYLAYDMGVSHLFSRHLKQNRLYSRLSLFSFSFTLSTMPQWGGGGDKCPRCQKTVYPAEKLSACSGSWHKGCFKCKTCT